MPSEFSSSGQPQESNQPFGVEHFPEAISDTDALRAVYTQKHILSDAIQEYPDFVNGMPSHAMMQLEYQQPGQGTAQLDITEGEVDARFVGEDSTSQSHRYYRDSLGTVRRQDYDFEAMRAGMPPMGSVPFDTYNDLWWERRLEEEQNHEFAQEMGFSDKTVGASEMAYISSLAQQSEPMTISADQFVSAFNRRHSSGAPTTHEKAAEAAPRFVADILNFLEREHIDPEEEPIVHRVLKDDPEEVITYHVGTDHKLSKGSPFVELEVTRPLSSEANTNHNQGDIHHVSSYSYFVHEGALVATQRQHDINALGETRTTLPPAVHYADDLERYVVRNFLRKPPE
ncbi:MAG TPA: hypothetical protein VHT70_01120 [Candidatus Saccharimonadales bacterium]|jgi:hypothetical protein|nr:hypothetical protein [Candidatus Saccharimonadales bacterium]